MKVPERQVFLRLLAALTAVLVIGCSGGTAAEEVVPTVDTSDQTPTVSATGEVVPAQWAELSFAISGVASEIRVKEGDVVQEGDEIARLDTTDLDIALVRAKAALSVAQANLDLAKAGPRDAEVKRAQDQLAAANARVAVAIAQRDAVKAPPDQDAVIQAQVNVQQAVNGQQDLQESYDSLMYFVEHHWDDFDFQPGDRTPLDGEQNLRYSLEQANLQVAAAQASLDKLLAGPDPDDLRVADAKVWAAAAQRDASLAYLNLVKAGASPADLAVSQAEVEQAQTAVDSAEAARDQGILKAPFAGTISTINIDPGELVNAGVPAFVLGNLDSLRIETTDLNEIDAARVQVGDTATVTFDALPNVTVQGTVVSISPKSSEGAGVNYKTILELNSLSSDVRWGMTAFVDIDVKN